MSYKRCAFWQVPILFSTGKSSLLPLTPHLIKTERFLTAWACGSCLESLSKQGLIYDDAAGPQDQERYKAAPRKIHTPQKKPGAPTYHWKQEIGTLLLEEAKKQYGSCKIVAETDSESVDFYAKSGFTCHEFKGPYGNLRYECELNL